jgi:two-component system nitrogen regulation sensor histidine kinase GlnL
MEIVKELNNSLLNHLASEIILLNNNLQIIWANESATNNGWKYNSTKQESISSYFPHENNLELHELLIKSLNDSGASTKRDLEIINEENNRRIVDLTISWSEVYECLILEINCVDSLNKIIDSTKVFSTQKIAANLARTLAHEVKNPLAGIKGSAQILTNKLTDEHSKKFLKIISDETERLNDIVTKILTPPSKPNLAYFNIHSALEKVYALSEAEKVQNIKLFRDYDPSIPELYGDENLFIQAILNIVKNAEQALTNTEEASITLKSRIAFSQPINGRLHNTISLIQVIDNGPGIPSEIKEQLFFPMISSKQDGSGLGLSIAQDIIRIHGGSISFDSKPGRTVFSIGIPLKKQNFEVQSA